MTTTRSTTRAGLIAALVGGAPSTAYALATGRDPLEAAAAAGSLVLGEDAPRRTLLLAAVPTHIAISMLWAHLLRLVLPKRGRVVAGALCGIAIAAFDLRVIGARAGRIRELPFGPQVADHVVFGAVVGALT